MSAGRLVEIRAELQQEPECAMEYPNWVIARELLAEVDRLTARDAVLNRRNAETAGDFAALERENDQLSMEAYRLRARLAEFKPLRTEWSTDNTYADPDDRDIASEKLAWSRAANYPDIHRQVVTRQVYAGPWLAAGGVVSSDALPALGESGCTYPIPSRAEVEQQTRTDWDAEAGRNAAEGPFWADLNRRLKDPEFLDSYVEALIAATRHYVPDEEPTT
jgi:hypothetical protein